MMADAPRPTLGRETLASGGGLADGPFSWTRCAEWLHGRGAGDHEQEATMGHHDQGQQGQRAAGEQQDRTQGDQDPTRDSGSSQGSSAQRGHAGDQTSGYQGGQSGDAGYGGGQSGVGGSSGGMSSGGVTGGTGTDVETANRADGDAGYDRGTGAASTNGAGDLGSRTDRSEETRRGSDDFGSQEDAGQGSTGSSEPGA